MQAYPKFDREAYEKTKYTFQEYVKYSLGTTCDKVDYRGADLSGMKIKDVSFGNADFRSANFTDAILQRVKFNVDNKFRASGRNLERADFTDAHIWESEFTNADLGFAILKHTQVWHNKFTTCNMHQVDWRDSVIVDAMFVKCDLSSAVFSHTRWYDVTFDHTNLSFANTYGVITEPNGIDRHTVVKFINKCNTLATTLNMACPETGAFDGWKAVYALDSDMLWTDYLVKLHIPEDAKRSSATTERCRCSKAMVTEIVNTKTNEKVNSVVNKFSADFPATEYEVGKIVRPDSFDDDRWNERSHGIHFFISKDNALSYMALNYTH